MPNMMDYLAWRGDIALTYAPFNDVDSLILSALSYLTVSQPEGLLRDLALTCPPVDENQFEYVHDIRSMLCAAAMTERFAGIRMHHHVAVTDDDQDMQFAAMIFDLPDGTHYVAFRGTDSTIIGWREDFNMAFESPVPAQSAAVKYLKEAAARTDGPLIIGGHSKGGNLAIYAAAHVSDALQSRIRTVYSFDGPGVDDATMASMGYANIARRIRSFIPQQSVVGLLMSYHPEYTVIRSDATGFMQHDSLTWQVLGTHFLTLPELDVSSQLVDQTVHAWLSQVSKEQRRLLVNTIFDILEATGATTIPELLRDIPLHLPAIIKALMQVDFEITRMILSLFGQFLSIGTGNVIGLIRQRLKSEDDNIQGDAAHVHRIEAGDSQDP